MSRWPALGDVIDSDVVPPIVISFLSPFPRHYLPDFCALDRLLLDDQPCLVLDLQSQCLNIDSFFLELSDLTPDLVVVEFFNSRRVRLSNGYITDQVLR